MKKMRAHHKKTRGHQKQGSSLTWKEERFSVPIGPGMEEDTGMITMENGSQIFYNRPNHMRGKPIEITELWYKCARCKEPMYHANAGENDWPSYCEPCHEKLFEEATGLKPHVFWEEIETLQ